MMPFISDMKEGVRNLHRHLEIFEAIARLGSVTAAAAELGTSQPTASRYLAELELLLGFNLFHRKSGRLIPTQEAGYLLQEVETSYRDIGKILRNVARMHESDMRVLRVAAVPSISLDVLPAAIAALIGRHPTLQISLDVVPSATVLNLVGREGYDIGIAIAPANVAGVRSRGLVRAEALCVLPQRLSAGMAEEITPQDLADVPFISLGPGYRTRRQIDESFSKLHIHRHLVLETQNGATAYAAVRHGIGATITDPFAALQFHGAGTAIRRFKPKIEIDYLVVRPESGFVHRHSDDLESELRGRLRLQDIPYAPYVHCL